MIKAQHATEIPRRRYPRLSQWVVGLAVVLFSTAGIAAIMGWRSSTNSPGGAIGLPIAAAISTEDVAVTAPPAQKRAKVKVKARAPGRCAECGQIESISEISERHDDSAAAEALAAGHSNEQPANVTAQSELVVRMADGSRRVFSSANPALWRLGERVVIIAGSIPSRR